MCTLSVQNDHDPSQLIAETPCKLMRFLVPDGSHVLTDVPYAEVEVMKMCMPLLAPASGTIHLRMSEGSAMLVSAHGSCHCNILCQCLCDLSHVWTSAAP
jgi:acetyl/propionyl-CoA carboxylase alpha subunit